MYYVIIISILLIIYYMSSRKQLETFDDYNLIKNGNFKNGEDIDGVSSQEKNFEIIPIANPGNTSYVLKQISYNSKGYHINIDVIPNQYYYLSYWRANNSAYNGLDNDLEVYGNNDKLSKKGTIIDKQTVEGYEWKKIQYIIYSSNHNQVTIKLGSIGSFTAGYRLFSDLVFKNYLPTLPDFEHHKNLEAAYLIDSKTKTNTQIIKSKTGKHDIEFDSSIAIYDNMLNIKNNTGSISNGNKLFGKVFSVIFSYDGNENEFGSLFKAHAINDINSGINIDLLYSIGVNNRLSLTIGEKNYIYELGLVNKLVHITVIYNGSMPKVYIDGVELKANIINNLLKGKPLGTCPDSWKYLGNNKCEYINQNKGTDEIGTFLPTDDTDDGKKDWSRKNSVSWDNCKKLHIGEIAPIGKSSCKVNTNLDFSNQPIQINSDKSLSGNLKNLLIYNRILSESEINKIYNYLLSKSLNLTDKSVYSRPTLIRESSDVIGEKKTKELECPFDDDKICKSAACECADWLTLTNITPECKNTVNEYCRDNYNDPKCNSMRNAYRSKKCKAKATEKSTNDKKFSFYSV